MSMKNPQNLYTVAATWRWKIIMKSRKDSILTSTYLDSQLLLYLSARRATTLQIQGRKDLAGSENASNEDAFSLNGGMSCRQNDSLWKSVSFLWKIQSMCFLGNGGLVGPHYGWLKNTSLEYIQRHAWRLC